MLKYFNPAYYLRNAQRSGYTIDQTILIVVIIAILITLVIITIGWNLINRTSGAKTASQLTQIEDAIGQFYGEYRYWPHTMVVTGGSTVNVPLLLAGVTPSSVSLTIDTSVVPLKNFLPGVARNGTTSIRNSYNANILYNYGDASQWVGGSSASKYVIIQTQNIPLDDAKEADLNIDGKSGFNTGRLTYTTGNCFPSTFGPTTTVINITTEPKAGSVNVCYVANAIN